MITIQYVGGHLDGQEHNVMELCPEFHFPKLLKGFRWLEDLDGDNSSLPVPIAEDVYVRLLDTSIYVFKGTRE